MKKCVIKKVFNYQPKSAKKGRNERVESTSNYQKMINASLLLKPDNIITAEISPETSHFLRGLIVR